MASGANDTTGSRAIAVQTLRILAACALSTGGAWAIGLKEGYWALITAIVVLQPALADTVAASRNRVIGTVIGACGSSGARWCPWPPLRPLGLACGSAA